MMSPLSNDQRKYLIDSSQIYESYIEARRHADTYRHGMTWKQAGGREYLFRLSGRTGHGKSLGPRSPETERILQEFREGKARAQERLDGLTQRLDQLAKINRALRLGRVPTVVAKLLRALDERDMMGDEFMVLGTQALFAYESVAGVRIDPQFTSSGDVDLMYDTRKQLSIASGKLDGAGLIGLLRKVDKSFEPMRSNTFRAANKEEFMVDLIIPERGLRESEPVRFVEGDLVASEVPGLQWLMNSPKFNAICIGEDGWPTRMVVPDPRAFSVHKHWLSTRPDREPLKKPRDAGQAEIVRQITLEYFPHLPFDDESMRYLPDPMRRLGSGTADAG
jgi:hypothetical protein